MDFSFKMILLSTTGKEFETLIDSHGPDHVKELMQKVYEISLKYEQTVDEIAQWAGTLFPHNNQEKIFT